MRGEKFGNESRRLIYPPDKARGWDDQAEFPSWMDMADYREGTYGVCDSARAVVVMSIITVTLVISLYHGNP